MISLRKGQCPELLDANRDTWTGEYRAFVNGNRGGSPPRRYAHKDIRDALGAETSSKCAYCESRITHIDYPHVEHILPKSAHPDLVCEWDNITLACSRCNTYKGNYDDPALPLVNPYVDDPDDHLVFLGPMVLHLTEDRGRVTVQTLRLNRAELLHERANALEELHNLIVLSQNLPGSARHAVLIQVAQRAQPSEEYSAAKAAFVSHLTERTGQA